MDEQKFQEENARHGLSLLNLKRVQAPRREPDAESGAWRSLNFEQDQRPWVAPPASGIRPEPFSKVSRSTIPFHSSQYELANAAIKNFQTDEKASLCDIRLNGNTGLPDFLFGDLYPKRAEGSDNLAVAEDFLRANPFLIGGRESITVMKPEQERGDGGICLRIVRRTLWADNTDQVRFQQYSPSGIPIYGAQVVITFDAKGNLAIVSSSLYPAVEELPAEIPSFDPNACWEALSSQIPEHIGTRSPFVEVTFGRPPIYIYPKHIYRQAPARDRPEDYVELLGWAWTRDEKTNLWRFSLDAWLEGVGPCIDSDYAPAVKVWFEDQYGSLWHAILDIAEQDELPRLIDFDLEERAAPSYLLFSSAAETKDYFAALAAHPLVPPDPVRTREQLEHELDFGSGSSFLNADGVKCEKYVDPDLLPPPPDLTKPDRFRTATVFYHLRKAQDTFSDFLSQALVAVPGSPNELSNPLNQISADFNPPNRETEYRAGKIYIGPGFDYNTGSVEEPGLDPEVIVHEFAHAVADYYFRSVFSLTSSDQVVRQVVRGLNEGQAFYLSSVVFGDATWSEYAYGDWASLRDLSAGAGLFDWGAVSSDPFTADHGLGIWLGRLFWQVQEQYAQNNQGRSMNYLLFKALGSLASPGLSNYTSHGSRNERLTGTLSLIATAIYKQCDLDTQQIFLQEEVFVPAGLTVY